VEQIEQVVRLIRSKGIGVYFITQSPADIPDSILGQLGNRVQHALRAFTPRDQKAVRAAAQTLRANPNLDTEAVITELGVGEALISLLDAQGTPGVVQRALICPPCSRIGPITADERRQVMERSPLRGKYDQAIDRESAHERLQARAQQTAAAQENAHTDKTQVRGTTTGRQRQGVGEALAKSVVRSIGSSLGRQIVRGVLGALLKGR
jgi:DNA helicase HerA-like ATPase